MTDQPAHEPSYEPLQWKETDGANPPEEAAAPDGGEARVVFDRSDFLLLAGLGLTLVAVVVVIGLALHSLHRPAEIDRTLRADGWDVRWSPYSYRWSAGRTFNPVGGRVALEKVNDENGELIVITGRASGAVHEEVMNRVRDVFDNPRVADRLVVRSPRRSQGVVGEMGYADFGWVPRSVVKSVDFEKAATHRGVNVALKNNVRVFDRARSGDDLLLVCGGTGAEEVTRVAEYLRSALGEEEEAYLSLVGFISRQGDDATVTLFTDDDLR